MSHAVNFSSLQIGGNDFFPVQRYNIQLIIENVQLKRRESEHCLEKNLCYRIEDSFSISLTFQFSILHFQLNYRLFLCKIFWL